MRKVLFVSVLMLSSVLSFGQTTTLVFKPNATMGKDAPICKFDNDCISTGETQTNADRNFGTEETLWMKDWTWNAVGCSGGTIRSLLCFTELSNIPSNAVIVSATLRLYGVTSDRNTSYSGAPASYYENTVVVQQVTSPWNENTVTWNTQPSTTTANQFIIPQSTSQYNWNYSNSSSELVAMVQSMVSGNNYGFMLRLQTEQHYRNMVFASSDHPDASLHPELEVTYRVCNPRFSMFMANSEHPNTITFSAFEQGGQHKWIYGSQTLSTSSSFTTTLNQTNSDAFFHTLIINGDTCTECIKLCMGDIPRKTVGEVEESKVFVEQGKILLGDEIGEEVDNTAVKIVPNPSKGRWSIIFTAVENDVAIIELYDGGGNLVLSKEIEIREGENSFNMDCNRCRSGIYTVFVKGGNIDVVQKVNIISE